MANHERADVVCRLCGERHGRYFCPSLNIELSDHNQCFDGGGHTLDDSGRCIHCKETTDG